MLKYSHMENVLFTRQRHEADRAGLHYDYRLVVGDKAHSWATKKELPGKGKSIMLWQQPVHTAHYALSERVEIPKGQYGAGVTTLDWVKKGKAELGSDKIVIHTKEGRFLLKKMPDYQDGSGWLFKQLPKEENMEKKAGNKYLTKISSDMAIAAKSKSEEDKAIHDYGVREKEAKNPVLKKAIEHAREEERDHSKGFAKAEKDIEKKAMLIQKYQHDETGRTMWHQEGQPEPGKGWSKVKGHAKYVKNKYLGKVASMIKFTEPKVEPKNKETSDASGISANSGNYTTYPQPVYRWPSEAWTLT